MTDDSSELTEVEGRLREHIESQFSTGRKRLFLSSLGSEMTAEKARSEALSGLKFGEFVETRLGYPVGRAGEHQNVLYIVPMDSSLDEGEESGPRYNMSFWTAFARPVSENEKRFINLRTLRFGGNSDEIGSAADDVREIAAEFVATEENSRNVADMQQRINRWLTAQGLEKDAFLAKARVPKSPKTNLLAEVLEALSQDQLRRTSLPLDVIKSLLS